MHAFIKGKPKRRICVYTMCTVVCIKVLYTTVLYGVLLLMDLWLFCCRLVVCAPSLSFPSWIISQKMLLLQKITSVINDWGWAGLLLGLGLLSA